MVTNFDRDLVATYLRPQWPRLVLLALAVLAGIGLQLANPQLLGGFIDRASAGAPASTLLWIAGAFGVVALAGQAVAVAETYVADDVGWRTTNALRVDLTRHLLALDDSFYAEHGAGELIERIDGDVSAIAGFFARFVVHVAGSGLFLVGVLVLLWREDWRVGGLLTLFAAGALIWMTGGGRFVGVSAREARRADAELSAFLEERLAGLPDIKANGADDYTMRRLHERVRDQFRTGRRSILTVSLFSGAVDAIFVAGAGASLALSVVLHARGALSIGAVFLVTRYTTMLRVPIERLSRHLGSFQQATGGIVRVRELLNTAPRVVDGEGVPIPSGPLAVELDQVRFAYDAGTETGRVPTVLHDVSLRLEPGQVLGLLGRTGSGKTTISRLVFRLHDVTGGAIRLGGVDVRRARLDELRRRVAVVTQDVQIFAGTVRDNVTLYDSSLSDARLVEIFDELGLGPWLAELPDGLDTALDTTLGGNGRGLSAGEAQLVALARVFLTDPGVVVLDEASSRLDPHTEQLLEQAITRLLEGRTAVVIAHRLATVGRADLVAILDQGRVVELGAPEELAAEPASRFSRLLRVLA